MGITSLGITVPSVLTVTPSSLSSPGTFAFNYASGLSPNQVLAVNSSGAAGLVSILPAVNGSNLTNLPFESLTTNGTSGQATLSSGVLNIPQYSITSLPFSSITGTIAATQIAASPVAGDCPEFNGSAVVWSSCGAGSSTLFDVNGTSLISQSTVNFESGTDITVTNPSAGNVQFAFSGTLPLGQAAVANQWLNSYNASTGQFTVAQPEFSNISGIISLTQLAITGLTGNENQVLAVNTSGTMGLTSITGAMLPAPTNTTLGGVESGGPVSDEWISQITTSGAVVLSQPSFANISGTCQISQGCTGQTTAAAAFDALAPATSTGGMIIGTGPNAYGNLAIGSNGTCLTSNGTTAVWGSCSSGSGVTLETNGSNNSSQTVLNLINSTATNGITLSQTNTTGGTVQLGLSGTLTIPGGGTGQTTAGAAFNALSPLTTLGQIIYGAASGAATALNGNTTTTTEFLSQTGTGSASAAPIWVQVQFSNIGATIAPSQIASSPVTNDCPQYNGTTMVWFACGTGGSPTFSSITSGTNTGAAMTVGSGATLLPSGTGSIGATTLYAGSNILPLGTSAPGTNTFAEWNGTSIVWGSPSGSGTVSSCGTAGANAYYAATGTTVSCDATFLIASTTNTVSIAPASGQDAVALQVSPTVASPTADIFQAYLAGATPSTTCSTNSKCAFAVQANGNIYMLGNSLKLGVTNQASASNVILPGGTPAQSYAEFISAALNPPSAPTAAPASGGSLPASTQYDVEVTYTNGAGETTVSTATLTNATSSTCPTSGNCEILVTSPVASTNPTDYNVYVKTSGGSNYFLQNTSGPVAIGTNYTMTSENTSSPNPPNSNSTGGAFNTFLSMSAEGSGVLCTSSTTPSSDCSSGQYLLNQSSVTGGTGITVANNGTGITITATGGGSMTWPSAAGISVYSGSSSWGTSLGETDGDLIAGVSGAWTVTNALPNGVTATTQTTGDNSTKVATDAFVLANAGSGGASAPSFGYDNSSGSSGLTGALTGTSFTLSSAPVNAAGLFFYVNGLLQVEGTGTTPDYNFSGTTITCCYISGTLTAPGSSANLQAVWYTSSGGGSSAWSSLTAATANLAIDNTSFTTNIGSSLTASAFQWNQDTAATISANVKSPGLKLCGNTWNGASIADCWLIQETTGTSGSNNQSLLSFSQSGSTNSGFAPKLGIQGGLNLQPTAAETNDNGTLYVNQFAGSTVPFSLFQRNSVTEYEVDNSGSLVLNSGGGSHIKQVASNGDLSGVISISSSTSGTHTFAVNYSSAPVCTVTQQGLSASPTVYFGVGVTTSTITVYASASGTYSVGYTCIGNPN